MVMMREMMREIARIMIMGNHIGTQLAQVSYFAADGYQTSRLAEYSEVMLMSDQEWEAAATTLANCRDADLPSQLEQIVAKYSIPPTGGKVIVGRDTRLSSPALSQACVRGVEAVGGTVVDLGVVTTPQLHYMVVATNTEGAYGDPTIEGYYAKISSAFKKFISLTGEKKVYKAKLMFDGANGVGAPAMVEFNKLLSDVLEVEMVNQGEGELNSGCGADYVKVPSKNLPIS